MKLKVFDGTHFQEFPIEDDFEEWNISQEDLCEIGITKQFDLQNHKVVDYVNPQIRIDYIKNRLVELSNDFMQNYLGAEIPDINERREEFKNLHNELRAMFGKEKRNYKF